MVKVKPWYIIIRIMCFTDAKKLYFISGISIQWIAEHPKMTTNHEKKDHQLKINPKMIYLNKLHVYFTYRKIWLKGWGWSSVVEQHTLILCAWVQFPAQKINILNYDQNIPSNNQAWWRTHIIPPTRRMTQEDHGKFEANLGYPVCSRPAWLHNEILSQKMKNKTKQKFPAEIKAFSSSDNQRKC